MWILDQITNKIATYVGIASATFLLLIKIVVLSVVIVWSAILLYGSFYYTYMPDKYVEKEVHLQIPTPNQHSLSAENAGHTTYIDYMKNR